jgi:NADPH-dependent curcumin reductase CurA
VCGTISNYNEATGKAEPNKIHVSNMIYNAQRIEGFVCTP